MGPAVDSRGKPPGVGILVLQTEFEVRQLNTAHIQLSNVMFDLTVMLKVNYCYF
jgi:hypothetical protein